MRDERTYFLEADLYSFVCLISTFAGNGLLIPGVILFCVGFVDDDEELFKSRWRISSDEMTRGFDCCVGEAILSIPSLFFHQVMPFCCADTY